MSAGETRGSTKTAAITKDFTRYMYTLSTTEDIFKFETSLSLARLQTYINSAGPEKALELYIWNARVSAAFLLPLQLYEVVIRNAVAEALVYLYGKDWPWSVGFQRSLSKPQRGALMEVLEHPRKKPKTTDDVIAAMKFFFWENFFTVRMRQRLWDAYLFVVFPGLDTNRDIGELVKQIADEIDQIRTLRNRIAHHEPIFKSPLKQDYDLIFGLINARCCVTADWLDFHQDVLTLLPNKESLLIEAKKQ